MVLGEIMKRGDHRARHEAEGFFELKKTPGPGFCVVKGCRHEGHAKKFSLCHSHYQYRWRMLNRKQSAYATLRDHARQRGIEFNLSYDYFLGLTDAYAFFDLSAESFDLCPSIDRIDATKGYCQGNLRIVTVSQNSRKGQREKFLPAHVQSILERKRARARENPHLADEITVDESEDLCPF